MILQGDNPVKNKISELIIAQKSRKIKLSGDPAPPQKPEKKEDFLTGKQGRVFLDCWSPQGQPRPSANINGRSDSARASPNCCLLEAIAAHLTHSFSEKGGVV